MSLWIALYQTIGKHPKTIKAAVRLKVPIPAMVGHLALLWLWCLDFAQDGDLTGYEDQILADAAMWTGDAIAFVEALVNCNPREGRPGFLKRTDGLLLIHDWDDYAGKLIDRRQRNADKQKAYRERQSKPDKESAPGVDSYVTDTLPSRNPTTVPNQTEHNRTHTTKPAGECARIECEPTTPRGEPFAFTDWFENEYPKKESRQAALAEWLRVGPDNQVTAAIVRDTRQKALSPQWAEQNGRFIPKPQNYLREQQWEDKGVVLPGVSTAPPKPEKTPEQIAEDKRIADEAKQKRHADFEKQAQQMRAKVHREPPTT